MKTTPRRGRLRIPVIGALVLSLAGHESACQDSGRPSPKRSFPDQLVRHVLERTSIRPARVETGVEIGVGTGPLALLYRDDDGQLVFEALDRPTAKEPAPEPPRDGVPEEIEEVEADPGPRKVAGPVPRSAPFVTAALHRTDEGRLVVKIGEQEIAGATIDRDALGTVLTRLRETAGGLVFACGAGVELRDVVAAFEIARGAGFEKIALGGGAGPGLPARDDEVLASLPGKLGWKLAEPEPGGPRRPALRNGELLLLVDGARPWEEVEPMFRRCAELRIWRIAFVGTDSEGRRFKIPAHLPVDG